MEKQHTAADDNVPFASNNENGMNDGKENNSIKVAHNCDTKVQGFNSFAPMFSKKEDFVKVLHCYRTRIFKNAIISSELMNLLVNFFVLTESCERHSLDDRYTFINSFVKQFFLDFHGETINAQSSNTLARGTYGKIYLSKNKDEVIKIYLGDTRGNILFDNRTVNRDNLLYQYIIELFNYIVWYTILDYKTTITNNGQTKTTDYTKYIVRINKPFMVARLFNKEDEETKTLSDEDLLKDIFGVENRYTGYDKKKPGFYKFCIGFYMEKHPASLTQKLKENITTVHSIPVYLLNSLKMFNEIKQLSNYGIRLLHRDTTPNNIMVNDAGDITLIDFGFSLISIEFADNTYWANGYFFDAIFDFMVEPSYDIILFILWMILHYSSILFDLELYDNFKHHINYEKNKELIKPKDETSVWLYPYKVTLANETINISSLMTSISNE
jgi:hypothetical protein